MRQEMRRRAVAQTRRPQKELMRVRKRLHPQRPVTRGSDDRRRRQKKASNGDGGVAVPESREGCAGARRRLRGG